MLKNIIDLSPVTPEEAFFTVKSDKGLLLGEIAASKISKCRSYLEDKIARESGALYGINTGFGSLCKIKISNEDLETLQLNLVRSHACGLGDEVPLDIVRLMVYLKVRSLSYGHSGVKLQTVERLIALYNKGIWPIIYEQGSLGASGDLAPLAHLSLPLLGEGEVLIRGEKTGGDQIRKTSGLEPLKLGAKEGLALLNGTQFMSAYGVYILANIKVLLRKIQLISALSIDAFDGKMDAFNEKIHQLRPHKGQLDIAKQIRELLKDSEIANRPKNQVQDPYSFRCIPQVHGASADAIAYVESVFTTEINSVTDNPNIFPVEDEILSGGNFHGQTLAIALDMLAIALAELGNISERRTYLLISGLRDLPEFLVTDPGLHSGFMICQYTAASIVSQNKQLCTPASVDSIVSSNGQEDHVSMGANAATKCLKVYQNLEKIMAIELMTAAQALEFRRPLKSSPKVESFVSEFRKTVPKLEKDRFMHPDFDASISFLKNYTI